MISGNEIIFNIMTVNYNKSRTCGTPQVLNVTNAYETARNALLEAYGKGSKDVYIKAEFDAVNHLWFVCVDCRAKDGEGVAFYVQVKTSGASGYACTRENERLCFSCAAKREFKHIEELTEWCGYFTGTKETGYKVTDWTGNVSFVANLTSRERKTKPRTGEPYNIAKFTFVDHKGKQWTGTNDERQGDIAKCKRAR